MWQSSDSVGNVGIARTSREVPPSLSVDPRRRGWFLPACRRVAASFLFFLPVLCYTLDVAEWSELLLRVMRNPCLFACARHTYLLYQGSDPAENCFQVDRVVELDVLKTSVS